MSEQEPRYSIIRSHEPSGEFEDIDTAEDALQAAQRCAFLAKSGFDGWDYEVWDNLREEVVFRANRHGFEHWIHGG